MCKDFVTEFHKLNGSVINGKKNGLEVAVLRSRLMVEEFAETLAALHQNDVLEVADGLADFLYVIYGTAVSYGAQCDDVFVPTRRTPVTSFSRAAVLSFTNTMLPRLWFACSLLDTGQNKDLGPALQALATEVCTWGAAWGLPMQELFAEVQRSNMTKTFAGAKNTTGGKYPAGVKAKGPDYRSPDIKGVLEQAKKACLTVIR
jgi:predicted HAD superfamily Cof-like phosphohydrolase